jgi:hypothetical protein
VQCVNPPLELPPHEPSIIQSINKKHSENLKCEPDVFIKIESAMGGKQSQAVNTNQPAPESETESEDSESGTESDDSSLPDPDMNDSNNMVDQSVNSSMQTEENR